MKPLIPNPAITRPIVLLLISITVILISGCYPGYRQPPGLVTEFKMHIGRIKINWGSNAFLNGHGARQGDPVYDKDRVTTGEGTSVSIWFQEGGFIQLDANTDPDFYKWFESARCIIKAFIQTGQVYVETNNKCDLLIEDTHVQALAHTRFNLEVRPGYSLLSVIEGEMHVMRPTRMIVRSRQQLKVLNGGRTEIAPLSRPAINEIIRWRAPYNSELRKGWCCRAGKVSQAMENDCLSRRGVFNTDYQTAQSTCIPTIPESGFCCVNGIVSAQDRSACSHVGGRFYNDRRMANIQCTPVVDPGKPVLKFPKIILPTMQPSYTPPVIK